MCPTGAIHGVNFPKELDKAAVKERIAKRNAAPATGKEPVRVPQGEPGTGIARPEASAEKEVQNG